MVSTIALLANVPLVVFFALLAAYMASSYKKRKSLGSFFLLISFVSIAVAYFVWVLRVLIVPDVASTPELLLFWQVAYVGNASAGYFLCVFGVYLGQPDLLAQKKWLYVVFLGPVVAVLIPVFFMTDALNPPQLFTEISDLTPGPAMIPFFLVGLLALFIPIYAFARFLTTGQKGSFQYRRAQVLLAGLVFVFIGLFVDGMKLIDGFPMLFVKLICAGGAVILLYGFAFFKEK
jgi:hypothetical protein